MKFFASQRLIWYSIRAVTWAKLAFLLLFGAEFFTPKSRKFLSEVAEIVCVVEPFLQHVESLRATTTDENVNIMQDDVSHRQNDDGEGRDASRVIGNGKFACCAVENLMLTSVSSLWSEGLRQISTKIKNACALL